MKYIDKKGKEVFVSQGLGMKEYGSFRKSKAGGLHRVKSPMMPMASSREEAQKNLDLWARKNGLKAVEEVKKMFDATEVKGFNKLNDADKDLFTRFCKKFYDAWEYPEKHKPVKVQKMKGYLKVTLVDVSWLHITKNCEWY
ncbi:hypothetical protein [Clostridium kluyveri]|uniref:Uncharacterized protein n=1 Tax=Clostridium kluyveri TaxID=1534 RepID=A0A1L5FEF6_CLOKL|nr:hypothetical protein [Clostridium kluyveri]APM41363.1 hypothetical protein BS101_21895 [Clostridium kluyveri]